MSSELFSPREQIDRHFQTQGLCIRSDYDIAKRYGVFWEYGTLVQQAKDLRAQRQSALLDFRTGQLSGR